MWASLHLSTFLESTTIFLVSLVDVDVLYEFITFPCPDLKGFFISFNFIVLSCNIGLESNSGSNYARTVGIRARCRVYERVRRSCAQTETHCAHRFVKICLTCEHFT